jgi:pSer/pThr/pTyr-binding forkhead associated (FHA) protein
MFLKLKVIRGLLTGNEFTIKDEIIIGRSRADLSLNDPNASSPHAKIYTVSQGLVIIEDLDSSNGLYVNTDRVKRKELKRGDIITIGKTQLEVLLVGKDEAGALAEQPAEGFDQNSWQNVVISALQKHLTAAALSQNKAKGFFPPLKLEVIQGLQTGHVWHLGFGPRVLGSQCGDLQLSDQGCPPQAFELTSLENGSVNIKSLCSDLKVNEKEQNNYRLSNGDVISCGTVRLRVTF